MRVSLFSTSTVLVHSGFSTGPPPPPRSPREGGTPIDRHGHGGVHAKRPGIIDMELPHRRRQRRRGPDHQPAKAHLAMSALPFGNSGSQCGTMLPVCRRQNKNTPSCAGIKTQKNSSVEPGPPAVRQQQADARPHANATRGRGMEAIVRASRGGIQDAVPVCVRSSKPSQQREGVPPP